MKLRQKKSCLVGRERTCRALSFFGGRGYYCQLHYEILQDYHKLWGINVNPRPAVPCPKPLTNAQYCAAKQEQEEK